VKAADLALVGVVRALLAVIGALPLAWIHSFAVGLAWLLSLVARRDVNLIRANVHRIYHLPPASHFRHHVVCALETVRMVLDPKLIQVEGFERLVDLVRSAEAAGKGHIFATAHLGSWELCAYFAQKAASRPLSVLAKPPSRPALMEVLEAFRRRLGAKVLWTDRKTLVRDMLMALKSGEGLGFVMDQKPDGRRGPMVSFLGQPTPFVGGPASMAARTQCAVMSIFCVREGAFRYRILAESLLPPSHGETDEQVITQRCARAIEDAIRAYPEQWTWN
jgi:Kdo2-lipid IVA lauroyltransferase/acyltransferase